MRFEGVKPTQSGRFLRFLYENFIGRILLKILSSRFISRAVGGFLDTRLSKIIIPRFVKKSGIVTDDYEVKEVKSFNDFFSRRIKDGKRIFDTDVSALDAPCDGLLSVYKITHGTVFPVKQSAYTVADLLLDRELAEKFEGGYAYVFRLGVDNYHRYAYCVDGKKGENLFIGGKLNTVRPIALRNRKVFCENCREYTLIENDLFGTVLQMEVGAMLIGKICNYHGPHLASKGEEKGKFLYGGSTVIVLTQKDAAVPYAEIEENTANGLETKVLMGQRVNE